MPDHHDPLDRRTFLGHATVLGAAAAGGVGLPAGRIFSLTPRPIDPPAAPFELEEVTVAELQAGMASSRWTSRRIVEQYLERIAALDRTGPSLHAILETNPEALDIADGLDRERAAGRTRGPLHGVPVLLKDNVDTADRMTTTAGSLALEGSVPPRDSHVAERLRAAGAVLLGKANMSEWANIRSSRSSSGWSARGGQCRNPYVLDRNPCGSSSGSAAAVSANLGAVAVGTETDGSIVCPAAANGVVGIKPTVGLVSRAGIIPISHTQDTAGPLCRTVADAAALLTALSGPDPRDRATAAAAGHGTPDYTRFLDPAGLSGARIGVARETFFGYSDVADRLAESALEAMRGAGAVIVDPADIPHAGTYDDAELEVLLYELRRISTRISRRSGRPRWSARSPTSSPSTSASANARCRTSARSCSSAPRPRARSRHRLTGRRSATAAGSPAAWAWTRSWAAIGWTPSSRRPATPPGPPTW
jgi:amidase